MNNLTARICGHKTKQKGEVSAYGSTTDTVMPLNDGTVDYCLECIAGMAIQCAWCGRTIFIGDPVTLFTPKDPEFVAPEHAVVFKEQPLQLIGCLRSSCCDTVADRAGVWVPDEGGNGHVQLLQSIYSMATGSEGVIIGDITNPNETPTVIPNRD